MKHINLFVPGRVSIIGELSDIIVDYIKDNDTILPGEVIAAGIEQGIYATATLSNDFTFEFNNEIFKVEGMDCEKLEKIAKSKEFYSYVASSAYYMKKKYNTSGISIKVRYMTLPIQKGLSSSAAICVLVAKAFNILYNLNLSIDEIMEIAYQAERFALSMCGRLDQICAKGAGVSHITFYEDRLEIKKFNIKKNLHFVIADLNGFKDTQKILSTLCSCFPFPKNEDEEKVKRTLCEDNHFLVTESIKAIETGNKKYLGELLSKAQENLDNSGGKICQALEGPLLHKMMKDEFIKEHSYGTKGTGSNGDGSIIILAKNKTSQKKLIKYLKEQHNMNSFEYNVKKTPTINSATINTFDNSYSEEKLLEILELLDNQNFNKIKIIGNESTIEKIKSILNKEYSDTDYNKLTKKQKDYLIKLCRIYDKIKFEISDNSIIKKENSKDSLYITKFDKIELSK